MALNRFLNVTVSRNADLANLFGGGWEPGKDPFSKGWRGRWAEGGKVLVVGRKDVPGAFTAMIVNFSGVGNEWDVAYYDDVTPNQLAEDVKNDVSLSKYGPMYFQVGMHPGWMLTAFDVAGVKF